MATGHSLEHPPAEADPSRGDFVESRQPLAPSEWKRYIAHEAPLEGPRRVVRAVLLSDTSPPLYYLLLYGWTIVFGTSDTALRALSLFPALLCFPLLLRIGRELGGWRAALSACALFSFSPVSIYYSTEGRPYALVWLCTLSCAAAGLELRRRGARLVPMLAWIGASAAGLWTHYFFVFVWLALTAALFAAPGRLGRAALGAATVVVVLAVSPWYARLPESLARWRITKDWLTWEPAGFDRGREALQLFLSYFRGGGLWGGDKKADLVALVLFVTALLALLWRARARAFGARRFFAYGWLIAAWLGPLLFDALRGTYTVAVPRYALAGLPAAFALAGLALSRLPPRASLVVLLGILASWASGGRHLYSNPSRSWSPTREVARVVERDCGGGDLVLVHSIPSGLLSVVRYVERPLSIAAWIGQLGQRTVPASLAELARGREHLLFVRLHEVGEPAPEEDWLRAHATVIREIREETAEIVQFGPRGATVFFPD